MELSLKQRPASTPSPESQSNLVLDNPSPAQETQEDVDLEDIDFADSVVSRVWNKVSNGIIVVIILTMIIIELYQFEHFFCYGFFFRICSGANVTGMTCTTSTSSPSQHDANTVTQHQVVSSSRGTSLNSEVSLI